MAELDARLPDDTVYLAGVTVGSRWFVAGIDAVRPGGMLTSSYMTTLGYAFPTGLGAKVGNPDAPVISLSGDGGFMYAVGELATAAQYDIDLVTLVFNNGKFGASQHDQREGRFPGRVVGTDLRNPDLVALAQSFGVLGLRADRLDDLPDVVMRAVDAQAARGRRRLRRRYGTAGHPVQIGGLPERKRQRPGESLRGGCRCVIQ